MDINPLHYPKKKKGPEGEPYLLDRQVFTSKVAIGKSIQKGDFCDITEQGASKTYLEQILNEPTSLGVTSTAAITKIITIALPNNKALVIYANYNGDIFSNDLTVSGNSVAVGVPVLIASSTATIVQVKAMDSSTVMLIFTDSTSLSMEVSAKIIKHQNGVVNFIGSTSIPVVKVRSIATMTALVKLTSTRAVFTYTSNENVYGHIRAVILEISGNMVNSVAASATQLLASPTDGDHTQLRAIELDSGSYLMSYVHNSSSYYRLAVTRVTVTGDTIFNPPNGYGTAGYEQLGWFAQGVDMVMMTPTKGFILFTYSGGGGQMYANTIKVSADGNVYCGAGRYSINSGNCGTFSMERMDDNNAYVSYIKDSRLYGVIFNWTDVDGHLTWGGNHTQGSIYSYGGSAALLNSNQYLTLYRMSNYVIWAKVMNITGTVINSQTKVLHPYSLRVIATESKSSGEDIILGATGIFDGFTGLIPSKTYYITPTGDTTLSSANPPNFLFGVALSSTEILIKTPYWERGIY